MWLLLKSPPDRQVGFTSNKIHWHAVTLLKFYLLRGLVHLFVFSVGCLLHNQSNLLIWLILARHLGSFSCLDNLLCDWSFYWYRSAYGLKDSQSLPSPPICRALRPWSTSPHSLSAKIRPISKRSDLLSSLDRLNILAIFSWGQSLRRKLPMNMTWCPRKG